MNKIVPDINDQMLVLLKNGSHVAFDFFYKKYRGQIYANVLKMSKSPDLAADILQDVFVAMWHHKESIDINQPFDHYLFRIARNKVYDLFRKASRDKKLEEKLLALSADQEYNPVEEGLYRKESLGLLEREIEMLPPKCREVFKLCKLEGRSYQEVAEMLNISTATVNNHIVKATSILKKNLSGIDLVLFMLLFIHS